MKNHAGEAAVPPSSHDHLGLPEVPSSADEISSASTAEIRKFADLLDLKR